ncbi:MAG: hypothetical protein HBSIN02_00290 [Bacteroidia bacterium]|nr:MAG: hypothetical protein HBSIN02_00290 [Bacteroidia bacterium]
MGAQPNFTQDIDSFMYLLRPPRMKPHLVFLFGSLLLSACSTSPSQRADSLRSFIEQNLYSTEHLAFGADPRAVHAVRSRTTESDIPTLILLLSDHRTAIVRVAQHVLVSYNDAALHHLTEMLARSQGNAPVIEETITMIQKRKSP